jgi:phosphomannomutase
MWKTGHSLIKTKMAELKSPLAGEMSGHVFFADTFYGFDDALYCGLRLLNIVAAGKREPGRDARQASPARQHAGAALRLPEERKFKIVDEVKARPEAGRAPRSTTSTACGSTRPTAGGCCAPPTPRPCWSARCESANEAGLERLKSDLRAALAASGLELPSEASSHH